MKGSEAKLLGFMEGANNRYVIPVYQRKNGVFCSLGGLKNVAL